MKTSTSASVDLALPLRKEYAQVLRLAVAGIASRLDFNWEQIEDIKLASEEAFLLVMQKKMDKNIHFNFLLRPDRIAVNVVNAHLGSFNMQSYEQKYSFFILTGLMDKVDVVPRNESYFDLKFVKKLY
ncbi:MAG: hypothetical protein E3J54_04705 [Actinobacteria bacterium]|nr:MAG: hypothetical protein E3J54_04705 [Actinomycetota bacterium]